MPIGNRIKLVRKNLSRPDFAKRLGISVTSVQTYETLDHIPKGDILQRIQKEFGVSIDWLLTGEGKPYFPVAGEISANAAENVQNEATEAKEFRISDAMTMAARVLESKTSYATALYLNIQHFDRALRAEARINRLEGECETLRKRLEALEARIASQAKEEEDALPAAAENK
jgi:transcriptional regulator with XRE-family HTH domain